VAPVVSLYVNSFNAPARRAYEKVGFTRIGTFASILF
jgi:predicted GNAT family acetyltransferase